MAGKTVGGVTITPAPAQPRILPTATAAANIGFGISISRTTKIPSSTTISAMSSAVGAGSGFAARSGGLGYAAVSSPVSTPTPSILNNVSPAQTNEKQPVSVRQTCSSGSFFKIFNLFQVQRYHMTIFENADHIFKSAVGFYLPAAAAVTT